MSGQRELCPACQSITYRWGVCGECNYVTKPAPSSVADEAYYFRELMALMHSDGGHYLHKHGPKKAFEDAVEKHFAYTLTDKGREMVKEGK
jgi:hypothetical protein